MQKLCMPEDAASATSPVVPTIETVVFQPHELLAESKTATAAKVSNNSRASDT